MSASVNSFWGRPSTPLGRWAVVLAVIFVALFIINSAVFMPRFGYNTQQTELERALLIGYGIVMMLCGLASGVVGLIAILRRHERSWMVWMVLLPSAFAFIFIIGEFLFPH